MKRFSNVQFITHFTDKYTYLDSVRLALEGGCRWVQLRMKDASDEEVRPVAIEARALCHSHHATFIIDDRVELVQTLHADGVHLGRNDMPVDDARRLLGDGFIIGGTANNFEDIRRLHAQGADYIGCGPFRFTTTKKNLSPVLGTDGYRRLMHRMKEAGIKVPVVAIGGITLADIPTILATGVDGIALSGTVLRSANPVGTMQQVIATVGQSTDN